MTLHPDVTRVKIWASVNVSVNGAGGEMAAQRRATRSIGDLPVAVARLWAPTLTDRDAGPNRLPDGVLTSVRDSG